MPIYGGRQERRDRCQEVSLQSPVLVSALHSQAAHVYMTESLASPQHIAPMPRVCAQLAELTAQHATDAVQLFGAAGVSNEYPINRYFRDAKVVQIIEGTNQVQRNIIANVLLGRESRR